MPYVVSTLTNAQEYNTYGGATGNDVVHSVKLNGGSNLTNRHLVTLHGAVTSVSDSELVELKKHELFRYHVAHGYLKVTDQSNGEKASSDLEARDEAAPMNQNDVDNLIDTQVNANNPNAHIQLDFDDPAKPKKRERH